MIDDLIFTLSGTFNDTMPEPQQEPLVANPESLSQCPNIEKYASDLAALEDAFGILTGQTIEIELRELLKICPRSRRRSDAYYGLISKLKEIRCSLIIKSRKNTD